MVIGLQYIAIAIFLIWGLLSSLCDVLASGQDDAHLVSRERHRSDRY